MQTYSELWAIAPTWLERIAEALDKQDVPLEAAGRDKTLNGPTAQRDGSIAILPLVGVLSPRPDWVDQLFGATSTTAFSRAFSALLADSGVSTIILAVDSPGGTVNGTPELADLIYQARGDKQLIAHIAGMGASAAFWVASSASQVIASPSAELGGIGVVAVHRDYSAANEKAGVKPSYVTSSKFKAEFNSDTPLSPDSAAELQKRVDEAAGEFTRGLARNRGVSPPTVSARFGQGRTMSAKSALAAGMVDGIASLDQLVGQLAGERDQRRARIAGERAKFSAMARQLAYESSVEIELAAMQPTPKAPAVSTAPRTIAEIRVERAALHAKYPELRKPFVHDYR
jgi:signal peptide peptidase SppA